MWGIYLLLTIASTCSNMPYGALNGCITPDSGDRAKVSGLSMTFANVSSMVTVIIAVPLIRYFAADESAMPAIAAAVLSSLNYAAGAQQPQDVLTAINCFITVIPAGLSLINGLLYLSYPISTTSHREIMTELLQRRVV